MGASDKSCPSHRLQEGSKVIGIVNADAKVDFISPAIPVTPEFIESASQGRPANKRFRFTNKCSKSGCHQWTEGRCGVIDILLNTMDRKHEMEPPKLCTIRNTCRWYSQVGEEACKLCPNVVTGMD